MGNTIQPHSEAFIQYLPHLWEESEEHNMLRCAIVSTLVQIVKALCGVKPELNPFLLPIIQLGTDTTRNAIVYLLEDSLDLWLAVLEYSTNMGPELMELFKNMPPLIGKFIKYFICYTINAQNSGFDHEIEIFFQKLSKLFQRS